MKEKIKMKEYLNREVVVLSLLQEVQERYTPTAAALQEAVSLLEEACNEKYPDDEFRFQLGLVKFACEREHGERPLIEEQCRLHQLLKYEQQRAKLQGYHGLLRELGKQIECYRLETKNIADAYFERRGKVLH